MATVVCGRESLGKAKEGLQYKTGGGQVSYVRPMKSMMKEKCINLYGHYYSTVEGCEYRGRYVYSISIL